MAQPDQLRHRLVEKITALKLNTAAVLLLEAHRPLAFIAGQALLLAQPAFDLFWPRHRLGELAGLLSDESEVERLLTALEHPTGKSGKRGE